MVSSVSIATEISTFLMLMLLEHVDILTVSAALAPAGVALVIWLTQSRLHKVQIRQQELQFKEQKRQISIDEQQTKLNSASLVLELDKQLRSDEFREVLNQVQHGWDKEFEEEQYYLHLIRYINYISMICGFYKDGVITETHMHMYYNNTLTAFDNNDWVHNNVIEKQDECWLIREYLKKIRGEYTREPTPRRPYHPSSSSGQAP